MNWTNVKLILAREVRDQLRDRRTLFMIAVLPMLLYPLLGMSMFQIAQFVREKATSVLVVGVGDLDGLPPLVEGEHFAVNLFDRPEQAKLLELHRAPAKPGGGEGEEIYSRAEARSAVDSGRFDAALYFPEDFGEKAQAYQQAIRRWRNSGASGDDHQPPKLGATPEIIYSSASEESQVAFARLHGVWRRWNEMVGETNLAARGLPANAAKPLELATVNLAAESSHKGIAMWAKVLPVLLLLWAMTGAFYPAVDLCAGEKERGTLETLLSSPAERSEIVLGKLLTVMLFSMATAVLNILSLGITGWLIVAQLPDFGPPPASAALWLAIAMVPVSALFSALCLALAALARSTKEGQYYLIPLLLVTLPLVVLPMAPGVELNLGNSLIPITGVVLLLRSMLEGSYWQAAQFAAPVIGVTLVCCLLAIRWAVEQFNSESVLFSESERWDLGLWLRRMLEDRRATPTVAAAFSCGVLILIVKFFLGFALPPTQGFRDFAVMALVTQLAVIATPALLMTVIFTTSPRQTLLLRLPHATSLLAATLLAVVIHPAAVALATFVMRLYPVSPEVQQALEEALKGNPALWQLIVVLAVVPAICEELAFRGFVLSGFRHLGHKQRAIVYSALFFGLAHGLLQQSIVACVLGLVLGYLAVQTSSILPVIAFHVVHNSLKVASTTVTPEKLEKAVETWPLLGTMASHTDQAGLVFHGPAVVLSFVATAALLYWFHRQPHWKSEEEEQNEAIRRAAIATH